MKTGAIGKGLTASSDNVNYQKTSAMFFSTKDNQPTSSPHKHQHYKKLQSIQPNKLKERSKENWNSHVFVSSPYDQPIVQHPFTKTNQPIKLIPQTFTTNIHNEKIEKTIQRPTMGGKTICAIHHLPANTVINHTNRMSFEELKLLSRRIDPHEPLSSPHASPRKPPLPDIQGNNRKRSFQEHDGEQKEPPIKKSRQYTCEPCKKVYKTRNGFICHKKKCKRIFKFESSAIIDCICENPADDTGTMVECTKCTKWLHLSCSGGVAKEDSYCCPRCSTTTVEIQTQPLQITITATPLLPNHDANKVNHMKDEDENEDEDGDEDDDKDEEQRILKNGRTIALSALCQAKERVKSLTKTFKETSQREQETEAAEEKASRNHFNFISLFSDELNTETGHSAMMVVNSPTLDSSTLNSPTLDSFTLDSPTLPPSSIIADEDWSNSFNDFNASDWCNDDVPSLLFSDSNPSSSFVDDFVTSSDILSSPNMIQDADWLHFEDFGFHFTSDVD